MFFKYDENKWGMKNLFCNVYLIKLSTNDIKVYELLYCTILMAAPVIDYFKRIVLTSKDMKICHSTWLARLWHM